MFKKIMVVVLILALLGVGVWKVFFSKPSISDTLENVNKNLTSYQLEANMELNNGEEQRNFTVTVSYRTDYDYLINMIQQLTKSKLCLEMMKAYMF